MSQWWQHIPADMDPVDVAVLYALHGWANSDERWAERRHTGLTDHELREAVQYELGEEGGRGGPGRLPVAFRGGKRSMVIVNVFQVNSTRPYNPSFPIVKFTGQRLLDKARRLFAIPYPAEARMGATQLAMWQGEPQ